MGMEFNAGPKPQDYQPLAEQQAAQGAEAVAQQTQANRPDVFTPFSTTSWQQGPNGEWTMTQGLSPQVQAAYGNLKPFDLGQFGAMPTGDAARQQAIDAAYNQASARLTPQFAQREEQVRARLAAQGVDPGSEAGRRALSQLSAERNDAFGGAMNSAIMQGTQAGESAFRSGMMARQQAIAEALRQRNMPMEDLRALMGFTSQQPEFMGAGAAPTPDLLGAATARDAAEQRRYEAWLRGETERIRAGGEVVSATASFIPGVGGK